jgi:SAM-dependent methyltransferase
VGGQLAADNAAHLMREWVPYPADLFDRLTVLGPLVSPGQRVLVVGAGRGALARAWANREAFVTGIDHDDHALDQAAREDRRAGVYIDYRVREAEGLGFGPDSLDIVSVGDGYGAEHHTQLLPEIARALRPGGKLVIASRLGVDIDTASGRPIFGTSAPFHPDWLDQLTEAGFTALASVSFDTVQHLPIPARELARQIDHDSSPGAIQPRLGRDDDAGGEAVAELFGDTLSDAVRTRALGFRYWVIRAELAR